MTNDWPNCLFQTIPALDRETLRIFEESQVKSTIMTKTLVTPIESMGILRVSGPDASEFLQAQLTSDIRHVDTNSGGLAGYCNPKGRLLAIFRILRDGTDYLLLSDLDTLPHIAERLKMYILRMKVTITIDTSLFPTGLVGTQAKTILDQMRESPGDANESLLFLEAYPDTLGWNNPAGFIILIKASQLPFGSSNVFQEVQLGTAKQWDLFEVRGGIARLTDATESTFIPQTLNLDLIDGVSFRKGCYPGQEIVARVRYLGKLKHRMFRAALRYDPVPEPGDPIFTESTHSNRVGTIVNTAKFSSRQGGEMLVTLPVGTSISDKFYCYHNDGALHLTEVPSEPTP